jgi:hypothetical protein
MPEEYDYLMINHKTECVRCYANVTRAGSPDPPGLARPVAAPQARIQPEPPDQAIARDISK